jgi:xylulose-5-phosphate/fructose-6-phosphate phosphoketolase
VRGYKEEGTTTTPFDMTVMNDLDRFHLVLDVLDRVPHVGSGEAKLAEWCRAMLTEHQKYIRANGDDMPIVRDWRWMS